eukprot:71517_1
MTLSISFFQSNRNIPSPLPTNQPNVWVLLCADSIQIIWPTVTQYDMNSCNTLPGAVSGIMCSSKNMNEVVRSRLHLWSENDKGRGCSIPHIKSYANYNISEDGLVAEGCSWFLLTSANLSGAAWGVFEKNHKQLFIKVSFILLKRNESRNYNGKWF